VWPYSAAVVVVPRPRLSACESYANVTTGLNLAMYRHIAAAVAAAVADAGVAAAAMTSSGIHFRDISRISRGAGALPSHNYFGKNISPRGTTRELMSPVIAAVDCRTRGSDERHVRD